MGRSGGHAGETGIGDLNRLAQAAWDRGLYRHAAALRTAAAARGSTRAATRLVAQLGQGDAARAAAWAAARVRLDDPWEVSRLLEALRAAGPAWRRRSCWPATPSARSASITAGTCSASWAR